MEIDIDETYFKSGSEWKRKFKAEKRERRMNIIMGIVLIVGFLVCLWMIHENSVVATMVRLSNLTYTK